MTAAQPQQGKRIVRGRTPIDWLRGLKADVGHEMAFSERSVITDSRELRTRKGRKEWGRCCRQDRCPQNMCRTCG